MASSQGQAAPSLTLGPVRARRARPVGHSGLPREIARYLGAVALFVVGAIHAQQYYDAYFYVVPTIGTLFLLNFVGREWWVCC